MNNEVTKTMPTKKSDIFTLAKFGDLDSFVIKFNPVEVNKKSQHGSGLLHYAISGEKFDIAKFVLDNGIDVNMTNSDGQTALHLICINQDIGIAKELLYKGIDVNLKDKFGNNAIWTAVFNCKGKNYEMVRLLMSYNPDIITKNKAGRSPLDFAMQIKDETLINLLNQIN